MDDNKILVQATLIPKVITNFHTTLESGHLGDNATIRRVLIKYYFTTPTMEMKEFIGKCLPSGLKSHHTKSKGKFKLK